MRPCNMGHVEGRDPEERKHYVHFNYCYYKNKSLGLLQEGVLTISTLGLNF